MLNPGDKCIIIRSFSGDEGKLVIVEGPFNPETEFYEGFIWERKCDVLIRSLGSCLHSLDAISQRLTLHAARPYRSGWLRKLPSAGELAKHDEKLKELVGALIK